MGIPDAIIEEIRQRGDLVELVAEHTRLKRSGKTYRGPCPLHGGEGPNFSVDPSKNIFKCFTCGESGDIFSFPMKMLGMPFLDSVRFVAERAGVEIPEQTEHGRDQPDPHAPHFEANAFAADWFQRRLWDDEEGREARGYLERRGITEDAARRFGLGWAPETWTDFGDAARAHGISNDLLLQLGLVKESTRGGREPYDAFRGRLIFPIEDPGGKVIAFGGRVIGDIEEHVPKYLNSPETPIYHKGSVLYGLGWSRGAIRKAEAALVVEGYMDYVSLASHGVENVVAPLGTAMTHEQAELVARYTSCVVLLYDSDLAGLKATFRSGDELLRAGVEVLVATLPEGDDPDSLVRSGGAPAVRGYVKDAVDLMERKIQILERSGKFGSIAGVRRAIDAMLPTVRAASDPVTRGMYIARIAEKTGLPRETVEQEVAQGPARDTRPPGAPERRRRAEGRRAEDFQVAAAPGRLGPERNIVMLLLRDDTWMEEAARRLSPADFRHAGYRAIFEELVHLFAEDGRDAENRWVERFDPSVTTLVEELIGDPEARNLAAPAVFFDANIRALLARPYEERIDAIRRGIDEADPERQLELQFELASIRKEMQEHDLIGVKRFGVLQRRTAPDPNR